MRKFLLLSFIALAGLVVWFGRATYLSIYAPAFSSAKSTVEFFVRSNWSFDSLNNGLSKLDTAFDTATFAWVANIKKFDTPKPGRYVLLDGMSNNALVNLLRSGQQQPIRFTLPSVRNGAQLAGAVGAKLECDSAELSLLLADEAFCQRYGFSTKTILGMFIPNTYEFYWNTSAEEFTERMAREYKRFWNDDRKAKAEVLGLSQSEVATLASIVQSEQGAHPDERPIVAGLYLNRLRQSMRLESDPTLIYAIGDYTIKRVLLVHREVESPYNTYKYAGLPPGPILLPEAASLDAVLNAASHRYLFMCAREDFSGYHRFATNYNEHLRNARLYQKALNDRGIKR